MNYLSTLINVGRKHLYIHFSDIYDCSQLFRALLKGMAPLFGKGAIIARKAT